LSDVVLGQDQGYVGDWVLVLEILRMVKLNYEEKRIVLQQLSILSLDRIKTPVAPSSNDFFSRRAAHPET